IKCVPLFMLLMFCGKNKGNKKGRVPSEGLDLNLYRVQKVLADTTNKKSGCSVGHPDFFYP
ncbi:MAG: hypothetical protein IJ064_07250, partial [Bacteroidaceae bacterium]|nr:hypothetical protein [Bacteroidaceae bacterium]